MSCEQAFMEALHDRGFRFTPQREMILKVLHHIPGPSTAEEIYSRVQEVSSRVDITTLYRTLGLLQELEFVSVIDMGAQGHHYELVGINPPHPHLICRSCGRILDLGPEELLPLAAQLEERYGFTTAVVHLTLQGLCAECRADSSSA